MQLPSSFMNIRKVDFVWVNSDMEGFEWFLELLDDMDNYQKRRNLLDNFLKFYLYRTGVKPMPSFTPLRHQLHQGKPRWEDVSPRPWRPSSDIHSQSQPLHGDNRCMVNAIQPSALAFAKPLTITGVWAA
ncbi:NADPH oxidase 5-like isoform X2 [Pollicipes pollicipes]|uniref:NADPH oxidase 5-like isoform X2 n=1 Tax=Pollicipes pollicipes TaxID=41117 RepID=UPI0018856E85|nr:NADPH oxidase 5-like isoform X2 [Pollicipes pollicipes]XP_037088096.1 NADPH oxidase 5-like isoform X2 [Pollicipes pollicipes]